MITITGKLCFLFCDVFRWFKLWVELSFMPLGELILNVRENNGYLYWHCSLQARSQDQGLGRGQRPLMDESLPQKHEPESLLAGYWHWEWLIFYFSFITSCFLFIQLISATNNVMYWEWTKGIVYKLGDIVSAIVILEIVVKQNARYLSLCIENVYIYIYIYKHSNRIS